MLQMKSTLVNQHKLPGYEHRLSASPLSYSIRVVSCYVIFVSFICNIFRSSGWFAISGPSIVIRTTIVVVAVVGEIVKQIKIVDICCVHSKRFGFSFCG